MSTLILHVPHLLDVEVLAALRRRVRLGQTELGRATEAVTDFADLTALRWDHEPLIGRVWELRENLTAYDPVPTETPPRPRCCSSRA